MDDQNEKLDEAMSVESTIVLHSERTESISKAVSSVKGSASSIKRQSSLKQRSITFKSLLARWWSRLFGR